MSSTITLMTILLPVLLLFFVKYFLPTVLDSYYVTDFYDSVGHINRGLYVTNTGHSNAAVDSYFDLQPGFFWFTGIILNVMVGGTLTIDNSISLLILKWFPVLILLLLVPILLLLYKKLLGNTTLACIALFLQFAFDFGHYHYAAQSFGTILYWLCLLILLNFLQTNDRRLILLLPTLGFSIIFVHEGVTIFSLVALSAVVVYPYVFRLVTRRGQQKRDYFLRKISIILLILLITWFTNLLFQARLTFRNFVDVFQTVIMGLFYDNVTLISSGVQRPDPFWTQLVMWKAIFMGAILLTGLVLSFLNARQTRTTIDKAVFAIQIATYVIIGGIAVELGGAGFIERILMLVPLVVYSIIRFISNNYKKFSLNRLEKKRLPHFITLVIAVFLVVVVFFSGMTIYYSGRNFQSITYSELAAKAYALDSTPQNIAHVYSTLPILPANNLISSEQNPMVIYEISYHDIIQSSLYSIGNYQNALNFYSNMSIHNNLIYNNGKTQLIISP